VAQELWIRRKRLYVWKDRYAALGEAGDDRLAAWLADVAEPGPRSGDPPPQ